MKNDQPSACKSSGIPMISILNLSTNMQRKIKEFDRISQANRDEMASL